MSESRSYYVYALKDPTSSPSLPFYVGKGTGIRAHEHELHDDGSLKAQRIQAIRHAGFDVSVTKLVDQLTEAEAFRIEAELISAFGTSATGGLLTNAVLPSGKAQGKRRGVTLPTGVQEKAQIGLDLLKSAVLELAIANPQGLTNSDICHSLGMQSDYLGGSKDYLSWSILGLLMREGRVRRGEKKKHYPQVR